MPIANNDPYFGALPPPDQDPRMVAQNQQAGGSKPQSGPLDDILMRMITQNLGQTPPPERPLNNWEVFAGLMHPELMNVLMARKQDTPQWQQYNAAQKQMPSLLQAYSSEQGRLATENRFDRGQAAIQGRFDARQNAPPGWELREDSNGEYTWFQKPSAASSGMPVTSPGGPSVSPALTPGQPHAGTPSNITNNPGQSTNQIRTGVKGQPTPMVPFNAPTGPVWLNPRNPNQPGAPITQQGPHGPQAIGPKPDIQIQSALNSLSLAKQKVASMRQHYDAVVQRHGFGERQLMASLLENDLTREGVGKWDPDARSHESDRQALALELNKPETGQNRVLESVLRQIMSQIPSVAADPAVAHERYDELERIIDQTTQMYQSMPQAQSVGAGGQQEDEAIRILREVKGAATQR